MLLSNRITEYYKAIGDGTATIYTRETIETIAIYSSTRK